MNVVFVAVVNGLVLSIPLTGVVWLAMRLTSGLVNAATRHGVWWTTLLIVAVLPLLFLPERPKPALAQSETTGFTLPPDFRPAAGVDAPKSIAAVHQTRITPIALHQTHRWPEIVAELWTFCTLLMTARLVLSLVVLHRQRKRTQDATVWLETVMSQCLKRCGVRRRTRIGIVNKGASPMAFAPFRHCVLIPARLLTSLSESELEQICLHEAAHLARFDDCSLLLQRLIEALLVLHPTVRWIARQIDPEREIAC